MPISAPKPNSPPSQNCVEAFHSATALSTRQETFRRRGVFGDDGVGMLAAVAGDMRQRRVDAVHHGNRQDRVQPLGVEIRIVRRGQVGNDVARCGIGAEIAAQRAQIGDDRGQQRGRDGAIDQQGLGGAADAGAAHLRVGDDRARHGVVGRGVDVGVAKPLGMRQHRHARLALHALHQRFAAARHDQVEQSGGRQHGGDIGAVGGRRDLHAGFGQARRAQPVHQRRVDRLRRCAVLSEPPRRITALPDLRHSPAASAPTLGRLS